MMLFLNIKTVLSALALLSMKAIITDAKIRGGIVNDSRRPKNKDDSLLQRQLMMMTSHDGDLPHLYTFGFDCHIPNEHDTGTNNVLSADFYGHDGIFLTYYDWHGGVSCSSTSDNTVTVQSFVPVEEVTLAIGWFDAGHDAVFIDHAWLEEDGIQKDNWDWNGSMGYCLSTDPSDVSNNDWDGNSYWSQCYPEMTLCPNNNVFPGMVWC